MEWTVSIIHPNFTCWLALILWDSSISMLAASSASWNMQNIPVQMVGTSLPSLSMLQIHGTYRIELRVWASPQLPLHYFCATVNLKQHNVYQNVLVKTGKQPKCPSIDEWRYYLSIYIFTYLYIHIYNEILLSHKKWNLATCDNIDGPTAYAKWRKRQILYDFIYMWNLKKMIKCNKAGAVNRYRKQSGFQRGGNIGKKEVREMKYKTNVSCKINVTYEIQCGEYSQQLCNILCMVTCPMLCNRNQHGVVGELYF